MSSIEIAVSEMSCMSCIVKIKNGLKKVTGINKVEILPATANLHVIFNEKVTNREEIAQSLHKLANRMFD
jgi:copper chaperone CopZ